jgi:hypothetical protein
VAVYLPTAVTLAILFALGGWMLWHTPAPRAVDPQGMASGGQNRAPETSATGSDAERLTLAELQDGLLRAGVASGPVDPPSRTYYVVGSVAEAARAKASSAGDTSVVIVIVASRADEDHIVTDLQEQRAMRAAPGLPPIEVIDLRPTPDPSEELHSPPALEVTTGHEKGGIAEHEDDRIRAGACACSR